MSKGHVYIIGGFDKYNKAVAQVDKVDLFDGHVSSICRMIRPRSAPSATVSEDKIFVFGGSRDGNVMSACEMYNAIEDRYVVV